MKKKYLVILLVSLFGAFSSMAQALELRVAPLAVDVKVEAIGFKILKTERAAIILTGQLAKDVAEVAHYPINVATEMVLLTGEEVNNFVLPIIKNSMHLGKNILVQTTELAEFAVKTAVNALKEGATLVANMPREVLKTLFKISKAPVVVLKNSDIIFLKAGGEILGAAIDVLCTALKLLTFGLFGC